MQKKMKLNKKWLAIVLGVAVLGTIQHPATSQPAQ